MKEKCLLIVECVQWAERASLSASDTRHGSTVFWQETSTMHCYMKGDKGTAQGYAQCNDLSLLNLPVFGGAADSGQSSIHPPIRSQHPHPLKGTLWCLCCILLGCLNISQFVIKTRKILIQLCVWVIFHLFHYHLQSKESILRNFIFLFFSIFMVSTLL